MVYRWTGGTPGRGASDAASPEASEQTLVKGLRQGDNDAYTALYDLYRARILAFVTRILGDPDDAHDVTQEVFLKAFRKLPADGRDLTLKPWLYKVASTTCLDHLRARRRRGEAADVACEDMPTPHDGFEQSELSGNMQAALDDLSDRHRLVLILKDLHGLRHDEIAEILGVSRGATETLLFRARAAFRRAYLAAHEGEQAGPDAKRRPACPEVRRTAAALVRADTSAEERRRVLDHARTCRDCRRVVRRGRGSGLGLAAMVPWLPLPAWLRPTELAARLTSPLTSGASGGTEGVGLFGQLADAVATKVVVVAAAATVTVSVPVTVAASGRPTPHRVGFGESATASPQDTGASAADEARDTGETDTAPGALAVDDPMAAATTSVPDPSTSPTIDGGSQTTAADSGGQAAGADGDGELMTGADDGGATGDGDGGDASGDGSGEAGAAASPDPSDGTLTTSDDPPAAGTDADAGGNDDAPASPISG